MSTPPIPFVDLDWQHDVIADEVTAGWAEVVSASSYVHGPQVTEFERAFAEFIGVPHCVGVANGTDALEIALRAVGVGPGDTAALPANTFVATAMAVLRCGATPRLVDVDEESLLLDPALLDLEGCRTVLPVHLFGQLAPMEAVLEVAGDRPVIEDAAQAQGARRCGRGIGDWGVAAATSFYPGKNLGAYGDAGAVLTRDAAVEERVRMIGNYGSRVRYEHEAIGFNSRLDSLQAVVLRAKLAHLSEWNALRLAAAQRYDELLTDLEGVQLLTTLPGNDHVWHLYPIRVRDRDRVLAALAAAHIGAAVHYPTPLHLQPALRGLGFELGEFPVAERAAASMVSLPMYPGLTSEQQERVVAVLLGALR